MVDENTKSPHTRAIAFFNVECRRVFETHQNKARKVRLEDSTTPYNLPHPNKAMALNIVRPASSTHLNGRHRLDTTRRPVGQNDVSQNDESQGQDMFEAG